MIQRSWQNIPRWSHGSSLKFDVDSLHSPVFIRSSRLFSESFLMDYPGYVNKSGLTIPPIDLILNLVGYQDVDQGRWFDPRDRAISIRLHMVQLFLPVVMFSV